MYLIFGLWFEDRLEGASNFIPWKERITLLLEECELWEIAEKVVMIPTNPDLLVEYNKIMLRKSESLLM